MSRACSMHCLSNQLMISSAAGQPNINLTEKLGPDGEASITNGTLLDFSYTALSHCREKGSQHHHKARYPLGSSCASPVVAFHTLRMCACVCVCRLFCCTFSCPDCMLGQMQILGQLLRATACTEFWSEFDTNLLRPLQLQCLKINHSKAFHHACL